MTDSVVILGAAGSVIGKALELSMAALLLMGTRSESIIGRPKEPRCVIHLQPSQTLVQ